MGSNTLRIVVAVIAAAVAALGAALGPATISDQAWAVIGVAIKFVVDFITSKVAAPRPVV